MEGPVNGCLEFTEGAFESYERGYSEDVGSEGVGGVTPEEPLRIVKIMLKPSKFYSGYYD